MVRPRTSHVAYGLALAAGLACVPQALAEVLIARAHVPGLGVARHDAHLAKRAVGISDDTMNKVIQVMEQISVYSWENGTKAAAYFDFSYPTLSVFNFSTSPSLTTALNASSVGSSVPSPISSIGTVTLQNRPVCFATSCGASAANSTQGGTTTQRYYGLLEDGAAADPASLGMAVLWAGLDQANQGKNVSGTSYQKAVSDEVGYLLEVVPRVGQGGLEASAREVDLAGTPQTSDGAISHRADQAQLWSDFVFMVPPFLAYYGMYTNNQTLLQTAYDQCRLYRQGLQDSTTKLWRHIQLGTGTSDPGLWATGNGWAAMGMLRTMATIQQSSFSDQMSSQRSDLSSWSQEIVQAASTRTARSGLVYNYIDNSSTFTDTAGSAILAAAALRLALLGQTSSYTNFGLQIHSDIAGRAINSSGYLTGTVDPLDFGKQAKNGSPEGQAFVMMLESAYREYLATGAQDDTKANGAAQSTGGGVMLATLVAGIACVLVMA